MAKISDLIAATVVDFPEGYISLPELIGKRVSSFLRSGTVAVVLPPSKKYKHTTIKTEVLTGELWKISDKLVNARTKSGLWIDTAFLKEEETTKSDNTLFYLIGFGALFLLINQK